MIRVRFSSGAVFEYPEADPAATEFHDGAVVLCNKKRGLQGRRVVAQIVQGKGESFVLESASAVDPREITDVELCNLFARRIYHLPSWKLGEIKACLRDFDSNRKNWKHQNQGGKSG